MEIVILKDYEDVCREVARRVISLIKSKPHAVLGLATGRTMIGVYRELVKAYERGEVDFSRITTFNLDEYLGVLPNDPRSFHFYMEQHFFSRVNISRDRIHIPSPIPETLEEECRQYEERIKEAGGIDLQLLGIGRDGHIGFNEPSSSLNSRTRVKTLTRETLKDNFPEGKGPEFAITMGLGTIMEAREIILVASGKSKAEAIAAAVEGPITASCPASVLQLHPKVSVIIDQEAADLLKRKEYYNFVYSRKERVERGEYFPEHIVKVRVPARICLFGEHQDYLGLPVISAAAGLYMRIMAEKTGEGRVSFYLRNFSRTEEFGLKFPLPYEKERDYLRSVFNVLYRKGVRFEGGIRGAVDSSIPINAGASSSTALVVGLVKLLLELFGDRRKDDPREIAEIAYEAEVAEFKEPGGKMDHYTCSMGGVLFIDFARGEIEKLRSSLSGFVLGNSLRPKNTKGILKRVREAQVRALKELARIYPDFDPKNTPYQEVKNLIGKLPSDLQPYAEAAVRNKDITLRAREILKKDPLDSRKFGNLLLEHHAILRDLLKISVPEIENMLEAAMKAGALGGKTNGSGGGGTMFVYAPGKEEQVKEAMEKLGKPAWILEISRGVEVF